MKLKKEQNYLDDNYGIMKTLLSADRIIISNLNMIKKELVPNYNHPKKMNDRISDG